MTESIIFALTIVVPNLALIALGYFMQRKGQASQTFIDQASKFVFTYCLPALLFFSVVDSDVDYAKQATLIAAGVLITFILFIGAEVYAKFFITDSENKGVFVQGVFRSNLAIIGLSTVSNAYGSAGLSIGAVYIGVVSILYNTLSVLTLSRTSQDAEESWASRGIGIIKNLATNPLILALLAAFIYKALPLPPLTGVIHDTGDLLSSVALPLALICAGASLDLKSMLRPSGLCMQASAARIIIAPMLAVVIGLSFNLTGIHMGVLFLMVSAPAAAAGYVMAKSMGGNEVLAANILAFTTVIGMFGMALGAGLLHGFGLI
ncbi:AEC family transporter [Psychrobacter frigidicola]|uniref:AEC family transporter n=1 Tax=Psychrobacter frigidicola TaxID=45611 RepID=A0A5C7A607_9GAMM|nr:AEC family transporter [Psychrobacter frigidicola]TXD97944.1 AEC family transporter [Psychrobacter frigidicola]